MGRAKLRLEFMNNEKARRIASENRMKGLLKKAKELSTLCGVDLCVILYGPSRKSGAMDLTVWPSNQNKVAELIDSYWSSRSCDDSTHRSYDLSKFFKDQTGKIEEEIKKLSEKTREVTYPKSDEIYNDLSLEQLKEVATILTAKIDAVKGRINFINMSSRDRLTESSVFLNFPVQENTVFMPRTLGTLFEQPNIIHQAQQQQQPLSYYDAAQSFTEKERRMLMLMSNNDPSCNNNGYATCNIENPGNYIYNCIGNKVQNCGLGNFKMEIDSGFTDANPLISHHVPQNGQGHLPSSSCPLFEWRN